MATQSDTQNILKQLLEEYRENIKEFRKLDQKITEHQLYVERKLSDMQAIQQESVARLHTRLDTEFVTKKDIDKQIQERYSYIFVTKKEMYSILAFIVTLLLSIIGLASPFIQKLIFK